MRAPNGDVYVPVNSDHPASDAVADPLILLDERDLAWDEAP